MGRKLAIAFGAFFLLLLVGGIAGYLWVKSSLWKEIDRLAQEQGAILEQPSLQLRWRGGLRFWVRLEGLKGRLQSPAPVTGSFELPLLETDVEVLNEYRRVQIDHLKIQGFSGEFQMAAGVDPASEKREDPDEVELAKFSVPSMKRPSLPVEVELKQMELSTGKILFLRTSQEAKTQEPVEMRLNLSKLELSGQALMTAQNTNFSLTLKIEDSNLQQTSPQQQVAMDLKSFALTVINESQPETPLLLAPVVQGEMQWSALRFRKEPQAVATANSPPPSPLEMSDKGGRMDFKAVGNDIRVSMQGKDLSSSILKKSSDWSLELSPLPSRGKTRRYKLNLKIPQLLDLKSQIQVPARFNTNHPELNWQGEIAFHSDLSLLVMDKNPSPWHSEMKGTFKVSLGSAGDVWFETKLNGDGLNFQIESELNPKTQEIQASGFMSMDFRNRKFTFAGLTPGGRLSSPFKLLLRQEKKFFFESELRFNGFSLQSKDLRIESMQGSLPVKQAWAFADERWELSPRLTPNAFGRADFESFEPLESRLNLLRISKVEFEKKTYGPVSLELKFDQNLLRSGAWSAKVGEGEIEGALQADVSLDSPRLGLLMRAFNVKLEDLLPDSTFRSKQKSERGLSYRLGMDWDLGKATAVGRLDWSEINSAQVLQILDLLDPQFENATFNQARMVLAQAYPTRVQVEMRGPVADIRINTNLLSLPDVRNVAISPYLVKANESLYASELYRTLRFTGRTTSVSPALRKEKR